MFGQKKIVEKPKPPTRAEQLGPKPDDIPNTDELVTFQVLLRHSMPSIEVRAHGHDFGQDKRGNSVFTHFIVRGTTGWVESHDYIECSGHYGWKWVKVTRTDVVFSIRTDDVAMVVALDNTKPSEVETLALTRREDPVGQERTQYNNGGWVKNPKGAEINVSFDMD